MPDPDDWGAHGAVPAGTPVDHPSLPQGDGGFWGLDGDAGVTWLPSGDDQG